MFMSFCLSRDKSFKVKVIFGSSRPHFLSHFHMFLLFLLFPIFVWAQLNYDDERMRFSFGTFKDKYYGQPNYLQIPTGPGRRDRLAVPKAFYHFSENEAIPRNLGLGLQQFICPQISIQNVGILQVGADSTWGLPDDSRLMATKMMVKNNRREINGIYLPLPHMDPINLHFITQKTFEKGLDTNAVEDSPDGALAYAKRLCLRGDELLCEKSLLHYHRLKSASLRRAKAPLHRQLMSLGDVAAQTRIRDRVGSGMGVVVGIPGYEPVYMGADLNNNNDGDYRVHFAPPRR